VPSPVSGPAGGDWLGGVAFLAADFLAAGWPLGGVFLAGAALLGVDFLVVAFFAGAGLVALVAFLAALLVAGPRAAVFLAGAAFFAAGAAFPAALFLPAGALVGVAFLPVAFSAAEACPERVPGAAAGAAVPACRAGEPADGVAGLVAPGPPVWGCGWRSLRTSAKTTPATTTISPIRNHRRVTARRVMPSPHPLTDHYRSPPGHASAWPLRARPRRRADEEVTCACTGRLPGPPAHLP
jgi:hypothetical protein